jgi:diguanylate cyclase (GGDEF)-like protein
MFHHSSEHATPIAGGEYDPVDAPHPTLAELNRLRVLDQVDLKSVEHWLRRCPVRSLVTGEVLVRAGETCPALYFVLDGRLRASDPSALTPDVVIATGDGFGELSMFQWAPSTATVSALEAARVLVIDAHTIGALVGASHALARNLLTLLTERLRTNAAAVGGNGQLASTFRRHATLDEATGLHNRRWLDSVLPRLIMRSSMSRQGLSLLLIEIDDFSDYSSQFGNDAGDQALYAVAQTLLSSVRPTDLVARWGAGRFAVLLPESDEDGAAVVARRIRGAVSEAVVVMPDESILPPVTVSIGAATLEPFVDGPTLLAAAEQALLIERESTMHEITWD